MVMRANMVLFGDDIVKFRKSFNIFDLVASKLTTIGTEANFPIVTGDDGSVMLGVQKAKVCCLTRFTSSREDF